MEAIRQAGESNVNFKTSALRRFIGKPANGAESPSEAAPVETDGQEAPEGTFNAGLNPIAAVKRLVPESVREKVGEEVESNRARAEIPRRIV